MIKMSVAYTVHYIFTTIKLVIITYIALFSIDIRKDILLT